MSDRIRQIFLGLLMAAVVASAQDVAPEATVRIRLVPAEAPDKLVSDLEQLSPVVKIVEGAGKGAKPQVTTVGERAVLWVRGASIDGKHGFERFYQGKFINRLADMSLKVAELGPGEHFIQPGDHRFSVAADGKLASADPDIAIEGNTLSLKLYGIDIMAARADERGPAEQRLVATELGVFLTAADTKVDKDQLPDPLDLDKPLTNMLSHARKFYPLRVYLPANAAHLGYLLYPYGQAFHVLPGGEIELTGTRVTGIRSEGARIIADCRLFAGRIATKRGLGAGVGATELADEMLLGPTLGDLLFTGGFGTPSKTFGLKIDNDFSKQPHKYFVADNLGERPQHVRLLAAEWDNPVLERGQTASISLRLAENYLEIWPEDVTDWDKLMPLLRLAVEEAPHPFGILRRHVARLQPKLFEAWKDKPDGKISPKDHTAVLQALNLAMHDPAFYQPAGFAKLTLSAASQQIVAKGFAGLPERELLLANRQLLADVFPGAFAKFERRPTIPNPTARLAWSPYNPACPAQRRWTSFAPASWRDGKLSFRVPDAPYGFYVLRVMAVDAANATNASALKAEMFLCILNPGQIGTASFISNKGRNAFVVGEDIRLEAVIRSRQARAPGAAEIVLQHPSGRSERLPFNDPGGAWAAQPFVLPAAISAALQPGAYVLTFAGLPEKIAPWPFSFDLAARQRPTNYTIIKPSKYTGPMNGLVTSWLGGYQGGKEPIDLDRAVASLAELGYNRIDLMTYITYNHSRPNRGREGIAGNDPRLMAPDSVYTPSPRDQLLNACVREQMEFSDVLLSYNDFQLPLYIEGYVNASKRWIRREVSSMRHSPAFAGMMLYDEMYQVGLIGVPESHTTLFPRIRTVRAEKELGESPGQIRSRMNRELRKPPAQRRPEVLERYLDLRKWELHGWGDYNSHLARAARDLAPNAKIGTYYTSFLYVTTGLGSVVSGVDMDNGYHPDVFGDLDICASVHYTDNGGGWVHSSMIVPLLRFGRRRPIYVSIPVGHEGRSRYDGQYQRHMAFAMLSQGADGVSLWGLRHAFIDGPNPEMMTGKETTKHLNNEILAPFGELVTATRPGYRKVGIALTANQMILSEFKEIRTANQVEELWLACWRLGYPAVFLREDDFARPLGGLDVVFVPGIRYAGELTPNMMQRLREVVARGGKVVVEKGSALDLPGAVRLDDFACNNYYLGATYAPSFQDDELNRVYRLSQPATDYLADKLPKWTQPTARGNFTVGPNWRRDGDLNYLVMANFEEPDYSHTVKQFSAKPVIMPLTVGADRGKVAYDLLAGRRLPLESRQDQVALTLDMTRVQGAFVAFLPEEIGELRVAVETSESGAQARVAAELVGVSGNAVRGAFPAQIRLTRDGDESGRTFHRVLGGDRRFVVDLPGDAQPGRYQIEVREGISGRVCSVEADRPALAGPTLRLAPPTQPYVPHPREVRDFLTPDLEATLIVGQGFDQAADELTQALQAKGRRLIRVAERDAYHYVPGDPALADPMADGFHSWRRGNQTIEPPVAVDRPAIIMGGPGGSALLDMLASNGFISVLPTGEPGSPTRPTVQVASRGLHWQFDTLCLVANDAPGMRAAVAALLAAAPPAKLKAAPVAFKPAAPPVVSGAAQAQPPAFSFAGNNEMVSAVEFGPAGNLFVTTWGHGDNVYSLTPSGEVRFSRYLPEMGTRALRVYDDRFVATTVAGARLFQVGLDGRPISQMRLPMDVGWRRMTTGYPLHYATFSYVPQRRQVVHRADMVGFMRVIGEDGRIAAQWQGQEYVDPEDAAAKGRRGLHGFAVSPDGARLAQVESTSYMRWKGQAHDSYLVIRDLGGKLLAARSEILANEVRPSARVTWVAADPGPAVVVRGERLQFNDKLELVERRRWRSGLFDFGPRGVLMADGHTLRHVDRRDRETARLGPFDILPSIARLNHAGSRWFFLDEYGKATVWDAAKGERLHEFSVPELGHVARFSPDDSRIYLGGLRGSVMCFTLDGKLLWRRVLAPHNRSLPKSLDLEASEFPDHTDKVWPGQYDQAGQLDKLTKLDASRLRNGNCEGKDGWVGDNVAYAQQGQRSRRSLRVGKDLVSQKTEGLIGDHFTWILEFHYKSAVAGKPARLTAGLRATSKYPSSVARQFTADDSWRFARLVVKSGMTAEALTSGFRAADGEALIDNATLRRIRFPSINHMLYEPIHEVEPLVLANPVFVEQYDPLGNLREETPNRIIVESNISGGLNLIEAGFLQNGRISDVGSDWYIKPLQGNDTEIALGLREPRWVSMVALYFNAYDEENVTRHFDILLSDVDTKKTHLVAAVRHNRQLFYLAKFPPHRADQLTVKLINAIPRYRTLTEIEVYGPLSGKEGAAGFVDAEGQNTYMGDFARVDKRRLVLGEEFSVATAGQTRSLPIWSFVSSQPLVAAGQLHLARVLGHNQRWDLSGGEAASTVGRSGSLGYSPFGALYGGVLLKPGNDGKLYCIDPASSRELWSVEIGTRLWGCPAAIGEDVYAASDTGKLVTLDLASGTVLREIKLSAGVIGSLASDGRRLFLVSEDGLAQCWDAPSGRQLWTAKVAPWTTSTPAVDKGVVYLADQKGRALALDAKRGSVRWQAELGQEFTRCPVVTAKEVIFGCRGGKLATLNRATGKPIWQQQTKSRFTYEPLVVDLEDFTPAKWQVVQALDCRKAKAVPAGFEAAFAPAGVGKAETASDVAKPGRGEWFLNAKSGERTGLGLLRWRTPVGEDAVVEVNARASGTLVLSVGGDGVNGYSAVIDFAASKVALEAVAGGKRRLLAEGSQAIARARSYNVRLEKLGARVRLSINGTRHVDFTDPRPLRGKQVSVGALAGSCRLFSLGIHKLTAGEKATYERAVLYFDGKAAKVAALANGKTTDWQVRLRQPKKTETKAVTLNELPFASLAYYRGGLVVALRQMNGGHKALMYNATYHQWTAGGVFRLVPIPR